MKTTPELLRISPDPLDQPAAPDPDSARLASEPPKHYDTSVAQALGDRGRAWRLVRKRRSRFPPNGVYPPGVGALMIALVAALLLAGGAYTLNALIGQVMRRDPGTAYVEAVNLGRKLDLTQSINGVTVTVEHAYADVNRIIVGYTIETPASFAEEHAGIMARLVLADSSGRTYPSRIGMGTSDAGSRLGGHVMSFDGAGLPPGTTEMTFNLTIPELSASRITGSLPTAATPSQDRATATPQRAPTASTEVRIPGPWRFTFTLPVLSGRVAHVNQTVTAAGIPMTLERVVVSPTETRAYLRFPTPGDLPPEQWQAMANLAVESWDSRDKQLGPGTSGPPINGTYSVSVPASLHNKRGAWTLTVDELLGMPIDGSIGPEGGMDITRIAGPWVFTFVVP